MSGHSGTVRWLPLKSVATLNDEVLPEDTDSDRLVDYIEISDVSLATGISGYSTHPFAGAPSRARRVIRPGDVLVGTVRTYLRAIAPVLDSHEGKIASTGFAVVRPRRADPGFVRYALLSNAFVDEVIARSTGVSYPAISSSEISRVKIPVPESFEHQRRIAEFLDGETALIDELIGKQEQLISTLAERLDSKWSALFMQLEHEFGLTPVRRLIRSIVDGPFGSSLTSAHYVDEGHRVIRLGNLGTWTFKDGDKAYIDAEYAMTLASHAVRPGDVLVAGLGDERMPLGRACVAPEALGPAIVKADCYRVRPNRGVTPEYLAWALSAPPARDQFQLLSRGTTRSRLNTTVVREARVPLPSIADQGRATSEFTDLVADHERLVATANEAKSLLADRRQALISAAVTGQIDVGGAS